MGNLSGTLDRALKDAALQSRIGKRPSKWRSSRSQIGFRRLKRLRPRDSGLGAQLHTAAEVELRVIMYEAKTEFCARGSCYHHDGRSAEPTDTDLQVWSGILRHDSMGHSGSQLNFGLCFTGPSGVVLTKLLIRDDTTHC